MKNIIVKVDPPCISENREMAYIMRTRRAYKENKLENNMHIVEETKSNVIIIFHR